MANKACITMFLVSLAGSWGVGQESHLTAILNQPEDYQRRFFTEFLKDESKYGFIEGYPKTSDHYNDFRLLVTYRDWGIPMADAQINIWQKDGVFNHRKVERIVENIAQAGTIPALDFTGRVVQHWPGAKKWIRLAMNSQFGSPDPNFITLWYHALESKDTLVREVAGELIPTMLTHPTESTLQVWGEALVDRFKREPTTSELITDPIVEIARLHADIHPEVLRSALAAKSKASLARRR